MSITLAKMKPWAFHLKFGFSILRNYTPANIVNFNSEKEQL